MSTLKTVNIVHPSGSTNNIVNDASGNVTIGGSITSGAALNMGSSFLRNRILNGAMVIDQRNAGASVTPTADSTYTLDRWMARLSAASKFSVQQNAGSVTPPTGFSSYLGITSLAATSVASGDYYGIQQSIEGFNIADLGWGTAAAQSVTMSFQVRSSLTGTFSGALKNSAFNRSYPFTFTINNANAWETKSITIAGDTSGTWLTTNGIGIQVIFNLGYGSTYLGTAGAWAASNLGGATGSVNVVSTNGATFYITGVQLEVGSVATPFEQRLYGTELMLCQRYFQRWDSSASNYTPFINACVAGNTRFLGQIPHKVTMRSAPSVSSSAYTTFSCASGGPSITGISFVGFKDYTFVEMSVSSYTNGYTAAVESSNTTNAFVNISAEL